MLFLFSSLCETSKERTLLGKVILGNEGETNVPLSTYIFIHKQITWRALLMLHN